MRRLLLLSALFLIVSCVSTIDIGTKKTEELNNTNFEGNPVVVQKLQKGGRVVEVKHPIIDHPRASLIPDRYLSQPFVFVIDSVVPGRESKITVTKAQLIIADSYESHVSDLEKAYHMSFATGPLGVAVAENRLLSAKNRNPKTYRYPSISMACHINFIHGSQRLEIDEYVAFEYVPTLLYPDKFSPDYSDAYVTQQIKALVNKCAQTVADRIGELHDA